MKILLAKRRALGDTVFLSATIEMLKAARPGDEISALVPAAFAPVLEGHPGLKRLFTYEEGTLTLLRRLRAERFDYFLQLHASPRTRWLAWFAGARRTHFHFQNNETEKAYGKHPDALEWDGFFLRTVFGDANPVRAPAPRIHLRAEEREAGRKFWERWRVPGERVIFLGLGASRITKRWPPSHVARLAELFRDRVDFIPAFATGPGEEEERFTGRVLDELRAKGLRPLLAGGTKGDFIHLAGLGVRELAQALSACRAYVGNDSGPKHVAAAVGVPTFTFFGPEDPVEWHPYPRERHPVFFEPGLRCRSEDDGRWCGIAECVTERHRCMTALDPLDAYATISKHLGVAP